MLHIVSSHYLCTVNEAIAPFGTRYVNFLHPKIYHPAKPYRDVVASHFIILKNLDKMKRFLSAALLVMVSMASQAQWDFSDLRVELAGNYTQYKGDFQQSTPGAKLRVSVPMGNRLRVGLGYTHGFPIKLASSVTISPSGSVPSEFVFNFKTISLDGNYLFVDEKANGFTPYGTIGGGLVLVSFQEKLKGSLPAGSIALDQAPKQSVNGFTINFGLGGQYSFGKPKVFAEAALALPSNQVNNQFVQNPIPLHILFNLGVRFAFGGGKSGSSD